LNAPLASVGFGLSSYPARYRQHPSGPCFGGGFFCAENLDFLERRWMSERRPKFPRCNTPRPRMATQIIGDSGLTKSKFGAALC
jgi:hypothetical protein